MRLDSKQNAQLCLEALRFRAVGRAVRVPLLLLLSVPAAAEEPRFWEQVAAPSLGRYQQEIRVGRQLFGAYDEEGVDSGSAESLLRSAADHFARAAELLPGRVDAHYWLGVARFELEIGRAHV